MTSFVLVHGSWLGGWCWNRVAPLLRAAGHDVIAPTLTGLGERSHLGGRTIDLSLHIRDVLSVLEYEELKEVTLVGHSYAGMVVTGVADAVPDRVSQLIYVDAVVPKKDLAVVDLIPASMAAQLRQAAEEHGSGLCFPPAPPEALGISAGEDVEWVTRRSVPMPLLTHEQPIRLTGAHAKVRHRAYIYCNRPAIGGLESTAEAARSAGWDYFELATGHDPMVTKPRELVDILLRCSARLPSCS